MSFRGYPIFARIIDDFAITFVQMKGPTALNMRKEVTICVE